MDIMDTINELAQKLQVSVTSVVSMSSPILLTRAPLASSIKEAAALIKPIFMLLENLTIPLGDFILFSKLPAEIRLKIWREALPGPRVVDVLYDSSKDGRAGKVKEINVLRTNQPPPSMLHVCHESMQETLRIYSQIGNIDPVDGLAFSYAILDLSKDTLFLQVPNGDIETDGQRLLFSARLLQKRHLRR